MSDRRWWTLPKVLAFSLWPNSSETRAAVSESGVNRCSSDDEDIEEFLEKQRNVRLGCVGQPDAAAASPAKSNRKFSSEERRLARSLSKRKSSRSASKSSDSTKYSSFGDDKCLSDTIYEVTGSRSQISFSFFNQSDHGVVRHQSTEDIHRVYGNIPEAIFEAEDDTTPAVIDETAEKPCPEVTKDRRRHVTKLTILLSPIRASESQEDVIGEEERAVPEPNPGEHRSEMAHPKETDSQEETAVYSAIDKNQNERKTQDVVDELNYVELNDYRRAASIVSEMSNMEYCRHRATYKSRLRKISLRRKRKNQNSSLTNVNTRITNAWKSLRGWWREESSRRLKQLRPQSEKVRDRAGSLSSSEKSFYESIRPLSSVGENGSPESFIDEDGYCSLELKNHSESSPHRPRADRNRRKSYISEISDTLPRRPPLPPPMRTAATNAFRKSKYFVPQGQDGFEELRRYIKQGGDFCKELSAILQERSEAEVQYAKTLSKLSSKLLKASKEAVGTVGQAWQKAGVELETTSEIHKTFATALCEDVVKPLKQLLESQHRIRKSVENAVDKTGKNLSEWRAAESKSKKQSFVSARENEKLQDVTLDVKLGGGLTGSNKLTASSLHLHQKQGNEKESSKLESKRKKAEEMVKKCDVEYYTYCVRAERARLEWETAVVRGSQCFQALEEERLQQLKHLAFIYWQHCRDIGPKLTQSALRLKEPIDGCDVKSDIKTIATTKGIEQPVCEQLLPDFYAEHTALAMNRERRRQALVKVLQLVVQDLERERRGKNGVENLARAFKQSPNFGNDDSQQNVSEKLHHMRFILTYLEAARYKISSALAELDGKPKPSHPLAAHIHVIRDRQGFQQSILKMEYLVSHKNQSQADFELLRGLRGIYLSVVPPWVHKETNIEPPEQIESPDWTDRGTADGNSVQPDSDFDEFSSQSSSEKDYESNVFNVVSDSAISTPTPSASAKCKALYHYTANLYDELNLQPGDVINIHDKQPDGWWLGELNGVVGIFPATYVEEIS